MIDEDARCIAHAHRSLPIFNRTMPYTTGIILEKFGRENIVPGDVFISNDPWQNAGHNPDITVITPFFKGERLVGFAASIAHHADVGGAIDTNQVTDSFEEGLLIPLVHLYRAGALNQTALDFIAANVRLPTAVIGDIHAQAAANQTGAERCLALLDEYNLPDLSLVSREIQGRSERAMRAAIAALPDGVYHSKVSVDELDQPLQIVCTLAVRGDEIHIDFAGTFAPAAARRHQCHLYLHARADLLCAEGDLAARCAGQRRLLPPDPCQRAAGLHPQCAASGFGQPAPSHRRAYIRRGAAKRWPRSCPSA